MATEKHPGWWFENLLFPEIFRTFRMAVQPSKLIIAFLTIAVICLAGWLMDFSRTVVATPDTQFTVTELHMYLADPDNLNTYLDNFRDTGERTGVFITLWSFISERYHHALRALFDLNFTDVAEHAGICLRAIAWAVEHHPVYCAVFFIIAHAAFCVAGGAICRTAALQFAQGEKPGLTEAMRFALRKFPSLFAAPLVPAGAILAVGLLTVLIGVIANIPVAGEIIMGALMFLALLAGALIAFLYIGAAAGFSLMYPAIAYDGLDCYDAISRSYNYVYVKPWQIGFYTAVAAFYGSICYLFVRLFAVLLVAVTRFFIDIGIWVETRAGASKLDSIWSPPPFGSLLGPHIADPATWSGRIAGVLIYLFLLVVVGTVVSFIVSFYFSANTIIYALMRQLVDKTALQTVCTESNGLPGDTMLVQPPSNSERAQH